jgi:hypothetical protein
MSVQQIHKDLKRAFPVPFDGAAFELVKVNEAARRCGINQKTLRLRIQRGEIPAWGKPLRVRWRDVLVPFDPGLENGEQGDK